MMQPRKLIDKNTKLDNLRPVGWDLVIDGVNYDIYDVKGYVHTVGGKWGNNSYWTCPSDEKPSYDNLIKFCGDAPNWGIIFLPMNGSNGRSTIDTRVVCWIMRNGERFYEINAREMSYALATAQHYLVRLIENVPVGLSLRTWREELLNYKLYYRGEPAIIKRVENGSSIFIIPDGIEKFSKPVHWNDEGDDELWDEDYANELQIELLDPNIEWFRD